MNLSIQTYIEILRVTIYGIGFLYVLGMIIKNDNQLFCNKNSISYAFAYFLILGFYIGLRPIGTYSYSIGDTYLYALSYWGLSELPFDQAIGTGMSADAEFGWTILRVVCSRVLDVSGFFTVVSIIYVGGILWACYKFIPNNPFAAFLVCVSSFGFMGYGLNGMRNGLACSLILIAMTFVTGNFTKKLLAAGFCFIAVSIHKSAMLPAVMIFTTAYFVKNFRTALFFWFLSIFLSLVAGSSISNVFVNLGFDVRMSSYMTGSANAQTMSAFSSTGFRFDFLLYSCVPLVIGYYIVCKRNFNDRIYIFLLNSYALCNSFWIMVIRASFSNRFAYLSWFMYGLVLVYPFLRLHVWDNQSSKYALVLFGTLLFTLIV